jgi:hypothetical protein
LGAAVLAKVSPGHVGTAKDCGRAGSVTVVETATVCVPITADPDTVPEALALPDTVYVAVTVLP